MDKMAKEVGISHFETLGSSVTQKETTIERPRDIASDVGLEKLKMQNTRRRKERDAKDEMTLTLRWSSARLAPYYSVQASDVLMQDEVDVELPRKRRELANKCKRNHHGNSAAARTAEWYPTKKLRVESY